ncbi:Chondroitin synthase [Planctomycetes bacterium Poly30]|uniref:Chondroitin synthase n=1 Tax=Saltatorellus ferox TaxID=2528018 RepID=A0A518EY43_9BACT|nr:Chondroitin synthase [Planctomycetes bacterium Poly30]
MHSTSKPIPPVSIGLPVYNGEAFLEEAIRSAMDQTFGDFELILCDNASTDGTREICAEWAARDQRVRWARSEVHTGAAGNFNRAFGLARGQYFRWAAHDDLTEPTYLERCVERLRGDHEIVLAHSEMVEIDEQGRVTRELGWPIQNANCPNLVERFAGAIHLDHGCFDVFGLIRRSALAKTHLIAPYLGSDRVLLAELALQGRLVRVDEVLFQSREHPQRSIRMRSDAARDQWFASGRPAAKFRPAWRRLGAIRDAVKRADLTMVERLQCQAAITKWALRQRGSLYRELVGQGRPGDVDEKIPPEPMGETATPGPELS